MVSLNRNIVKCSVFAKFSKMSQENRDPMQAVCFTSQHPSQSIATSDGKSGSGPKECLRTLFDAKQKNEKSVNVRKSSGEESKRKSCLRKSFDPKQSNRRVTFSSPIARAQPFFILQSAKSLNRVLYPPAIHPCNVYMNTRLQKERQHQASRQNSSTISKEVKWRPSTTWKSFVCMSFDFSFLFFFSKRQQLLESINRTAYNININKKNGIPSKILQRAARMTDDRVFLFIKKTS